MFLPILTHFIHPSPREPHACDHVTIIKSVTHLGQRSLYPYSYLYINQASITSPFLYYFVLLDIGWLLHDTSTTH